MATDAAPVPHVVGDAGEPLEIAAVVKDAHRITLADAPLGRVLRADHDELLALPFDLVLLVGVAGIEETVALRRDDVERIALGPDVGIRDLAPLPDGRLLILAGAAYGSEIPYSIFVVDPTGVNLQELLPPQSDRPTRAEGMTVLEATDKEIRLLILFDKADRAPQEVRIRR